MPLTVVRGFLLVMSVLALLTATVLDGVMMRVFMHPFVALSERAGAPRVPGPIAFMMERAWARRLYHLAFAALLLGLWWYLGTDGGAAHWATMTAGAPDGRAR